VVRTRVGYAGGSTEQPTYHDLADHTEAFQIDFDPTRLSYEQLVAEIWANRRGGRSYSRQYMEAVFAANAGQAAIAKARGVTAPIIEGARFWVAEDYHQKYYLRHDSTLMRELADYTPAQLRESAVAARLNGYVAGRGNAAQLNDEISTFGLSSDASSYLQRVVARR